MPGRRAAEMGEVAVETNTQSGVETVGTGSAQPGLGPGPVRARRRVVEAVEVVEVVRPHDGVQDLTTAHVVQLAQRGDGDGGSLVPAAPLVHADDGAVPQIDHGPARDSLDRRLAGEEQRLAVQCGRLSDAVPHTEVAGLP